MTKYGRSKSKKGGVNSICDVCVGCNKSEPADAGSSLDLWIPAVNS